MNIRTKVFTTFAAMAMAASTALTGAAQEAVTDTSSVTVDGGGFSVSLSASNFNNVPFSLIDQEAENGSIVLNVNDMTGDAGGWQVTLSITDFRGQSDPTVVIPVDGLVIDEDSITITLAHPDSQPVTDGMTPVSNEGAPQLTWTAPAGEGQGSYNLYMGASLIVPGLTIAQTYTATGTVQIVSGP